MKKLISTILSIALLSGFVMPNISFASQDKDLEKLILKSKTILKIGDEYSKFDYSISRDEDIATYDFSWRNDQDTDYVSVGIDSEGFIKNYNKYSSLDNYENKIPKVTQAEGQKIAEDFLKQINPDIKDSLKYKRNNESRYTEINSYYFEFVRMENGIPYTNNSANVNVNNITGQVDSYYSSWDKNISFPKEETVISKEEAARLYKEKVKFELMYKYNFSSKDQKPQLVYSVEDKNKSIDAKTGEVLDYSNEYYDGMMKDEGLGGGENNGLTQEEIDAIKLAKEMIGENQAESIAREFAQIDKDYKLSSLNMFKQGNGYRWYLDFTKQENNRSESSQVSIDAKTKEVMHFNKHTENIVGQKEKYNKDQALEIAKEYLSKVQGEKSKQVEYIDLNYPMDSIYNNESPDIYTFKFTRRVNGVLFDGDGFNVRVNSVDGEIVGYDTTWYNGELPGKSAFVDKEQAYKTFVEQAKLELQYINISNDKKDTVLAYVLSKKDNIDIDAKTGKPVDLYSYGSNYEQEKPNYVDIDKSIAKNQILALKEIGIYLPGTKFNPKGEITQRDFLYLLCKTKDSYIDYKEIDEMYKVMISQKIVRKGEKAPEGNIIREEAIKYIIRSLNYDRVADLKNIYVLDFKDREDIAPNLRGYVAIAKGLGIVNGTSDGKFKPTDTLTREQAVVVIYNVLNLEK